MPAKKKPQSHPGDRGKGGGAKTKTFDPFDRRKDESISDWYVRVEPMVSRLRKEVNKKKKP